MLEIDIKLDSIFVRHVRLYSCFLMLDKFAFGLHSESITLNNLWNNYRVLVFSPWISNVSFWFSKNISRKAKPLTRTIFFSGFQSQSGFCLISLCFAEANVMHIFWDPSLVLHLLISWQPASQPVTSPTCISRGVNWLSFKRTITRTEDECATIGPVTWLEPNILVSVYLTNVWCEHCLIGGSN